MRVFKRKRKSISLFLVALMVLQNIGIPSANALTSGPSQPEVQSFEPATTTQMVDLFSGDFVYNIPLFELPGPDGGYPFSLNYHAGVSMDQESSWCGLGWNISPGHLSRQTRGLPDEFDGDLVKTKMAIAPSVTVGLGAGVGLEFFGKQLKSKRKTPDELPKLAIGFGLNVYHNNYRGLGYSIDGSGGYFAAVGSKMTGSTRLDVSLDAKEGIGVSPSLGLDSKIGGFGLDAGYHSKEGLYNVSATYQYPKDVKIKFKDSNGKKQVIPVSMKGGASLRLAHPSYIPQITMPMRNISVRATFKTGAAFWGTFPNGHASGFYNEQWLKNNKDVISSKAYGYLNYQHADDSRALLDFSREKDGMVSQFTPNLAMPSLTYDIYSITGEGIAAMYRPFRNDRGVIYDPETKSISKGVGLGIDLAPTASHNGPNLQLNRSKSVSGKWSGNNQIASKTLFQDTTLNSLYEPWYYKIHGETSGESASLLKSIGGTSAVKIKLSPGKSPDAEATLERKGWSQPVPDNSTDHRERKERANAVIPVTNEQLLDNSGAEVLSFFKVQYQTAGGQQQLFDRSSLPKHHLAGFTTLTAEGLRYNYGIPAYNLFQEEVTFSVQKQLGNVSRVEVKNNGGQEPVYSYNDTEQFLKRVEMPPYAHSYLLTSVVGPDYVDLTGDGVTQDDLGYWVKFTYKKTTTDTDRYKWRDPYSKAHFIEGWKTDPRDDKGHFVYGEKELWYLAQAETKSHIAVFTTEERQDGYGVATKLQDTNGRGKAVHALREINLFTRSAGSNFPIKKVKLEYDYTLCNGIDNSATGDGKLTLKKVWFEYGNSLRGSLNPYEFTYHTSNPSYDIHAYDRWGNFKPYPAGDYLHNQDFPYAEQDPSRKNEIDGRAASWSLATIRLPSGGKIMIDYESDDYAYVQHKAAMQMVEIVDPNSPSAGPLNSEFNVQDGNYKVRFRLERKIPGDSVFSQPDVVRKYVNPTNRQLFFKLLINLRSSSENFHEYISGYADVDFNGSMGLEQDESGYYAYGFFYVKPEKGHHPFSMRAWQHLRTNQPDLANSGRKLKQTNSNSERVSQLKSLMGITAQVRQMFEGFYNYCSKKGWGREVVAGKSWVRLTSPDKIKYGGGLRVRQITMKDQWTNDEEGIYGQVYEYAMEEDGKVISSGVASYEPVIGGEENALRYAKKYVQSIPLRSDNNLYFEYPINESYYPAPHVGYRKVTVSSLAAANLAGKPVKHLQLSDGSNLFPQGTNVGYGTTGMTVYEFYTAKEFPVITDETEKENRPSKLNVAVPFLGAVSISKLTASQGYSIVINDMHGKQKQVSHYRQNKNGAINPDAISWIRYNYQADSLIYQQEKVFVLANTFKDNGDGTLSRATSSEINNPSVETCALGQENEFFMDMREFNDKAWTAGFNLNLDMVYIPTFLGPIPIPIPTGWPNLSKSQAQLRVAVTNKVIFRTGILTSVEAFDAGSIVKTENIRWDKLTGLPVLTMTTNNFDAPVYSYSIPAYTQYAGMSAAYKNIGLCFRIGEVTQNGFDNTLYSFTTSMGEGILHPGDEIILYSSEGGGKKAVARVIYTGEEGGLHTIYSQAPLSLSMYDGMVVRSGYRNHLDVMAGSVRALSDPLEPGTQKTYSKIISIPK